MGNAECYFHFLDGLATLPAKSMKPVRRSLIKKMNGWSQQNSGSRDPKHKGTKSNSVAAAASDPSSLTSTTAFCNKAETFN